MNAFRSIHGFSLSILAVTLFASSQAQDAPPSPQGSIIVKELPPPPPNPNEGKGLITKPLVRPTGGEGSQVDPTAEVKWSFEALDKNKDGKLAKEELPERSRPLFSRTDANGDGSISLAEQVAYLGVGPLVKKLVAKTEKPSLPIGVEAFRDIAYADTDNPRQKLDLYFPKSSKGDTPLPVVVFIHGGGWSKGDRASGARYVTRLVATQRYVGVSIGYRLSDEAQWPAQMHDCKAAIRWLKAHAAEYFLDPQKIAVWGASAGGHLASMLGTSGDVKELEGTLGKHLDQDSRVACVVNYFGPQNFITMIRQPSSIDRTKGDQYPEARLLGGAVPEREAVAKEASPITHISPGDAAFFTAHGTKDPLVPYAQAQELHAALTKAGVPSHLQEITNGGHGFQSTDLDQRVGQFLDMHLLGEKAKINATPIVFPAKQK